MSWRVEIEKIDAGTGKVLQGMVCSEPVEMRKAFNSWFKELLAGPDARIYIIVYHRPSGRYLSSRITRDGRSYKAEAAGDRMTLEKALKAMKDQLTAHWRAMTECRR
jgi:hypothetical protein